MFVVIIRTSELRNPHASAIAIQHPLSDDLSCCHAIHMIHLNSRGFTHTIQKLRLHINYSKILFTWDQWGRDSSKIQTKALQQCDSLWLFRVRAYYDKSRNPIKSCNSNLQYNMHINSYPAEFIFSLRITWHRVDLDPMRISQFTVLISGQLLS